MPCNERTGGVDAVAAVATGEKSPFVPGATEYAPPPNTDSPAHTIFN